MPEVPDEKRMKLRYAGICRVCGATLEARVEAVYERSTKTIRCTTCCPTPTPSSVVEPGRATPGVETLEPTSQVGPTSLVEPGRAAPGVETTEPIEAGTPGASARREFERRKAKRETRIREKHPKLGGLILAMSDDPQSTTAWNTGALGEERLGQRLNELASEGKIRVLHDRRIPGTRANIDHIAITPAGIYVIDAKRYVNKRPTLKVEGGVLRPRTEKLLVGGRDQTKLVDGVLKQVDVVRRVVGDGVPVRGVLCFIESDWPLIGGAFTTRGVEVLWPKKLYPRLGATGPHDANVEALHQTVAAALPTA